MYHGSRRQVNILKDLTGKDFPSKAYVNISLKRTTPVQSDPMNCSQFISQILKKIRQSFLEP